MKFIDFLKDNIVLLDGGTGTILQSRGLPAGTAPMEWNESHAEEIIRLHREYFDAGSNMVCTNTFGADVLHLSPEKLESTVKAAIANARQAAKESKGTQEKFVALDISSTGKLLKPLGDLDFEDAVSVFAETVKLGAKYGADAVIIETMNDSYETKAAVLAAKENCDLPILVSNAYGADGKLMTGADAAAMTALLEGMNVTAFGANCSLGPRQLFPVVEKMLEVSSTPTLFKPNAGLPRDCCGETQYDVTPEEFARDVASMVKKGVRIVGGCCGTTPEHIRLLKKEIEGAKPLPITDKNLSMISCGSGAVIFAEKPILIGERINPTGKKRLKAAIKEHDMGYILSEGVRQRENGADVLDVNVGLPGIDEGQVLTDAVRELQSVVSLPLQIDTADPAAMEKALRIVNGKPLLNSVSGKKESMEKVFPLARKYGGMIVALTLDEDGIPATAEGRFAIAEKIVKTAAEYGIKPCNLLFDPLAMTVSADKNAAKITLQALKMIMERLHVHTSLGVSNVSFGLPERGTLNAAFLLTALENGLSAAIMNPDSREMMAAYHSFLALHGLDDNCEQYIGYVSAHPVVTSTGTSVTQSKHEYASDLQAAVCKGLKSDAEKALKALLDVKKPLEIINDEMIPALNTVGEAFEKKTLFLPQLLMSAEAAGAAFAILKENMKGENVPSKCDFVLATVRGDVHDIGKNIVRMLLENYGYIVHDLGKDVPPEDILKAVERVHAPLCGLSALMTTTVPAMEETIALLHEKAPYCRVVVGGAVLTEEYAKRIGADKYAADAMETVRYAEESMKQI